MAKGGENRGWNQEIKYWDGEGGLILKSVKLGMEIKVGGNYKRPKSKIAV